jgi:hypothetical protein
MLALDQGEHMIPPVWPRPVTGTTVFVKEEANGAWHEGLCGGMSGRGASWRVALTTTTGIDATITSDQMNHSLRRTDWRPRDAVFVREYGFYRPPGMKFVEEVDDVDDDGKKRRIAAHWVYDKDVAKLDKGVLRTAGGNLLPSVGELPDPKEREVHTAWKARCRTKFAVLDSPEGKKFLDDAWHQKK